MKNVLRKLQGKKTCKKVCSIIKDTDKYLVLVKDKKRITLIGGSVDNGETTRNAIVREVFEECCGKVVKMKYLTKNYYSVNWEFEGITFPNKRVEYYYLCQIEKGNLSAKGLQGEFNKNTSLKWCTVAELEKLGLDQYELNLIKKIENENIEV